MAAKKFPKFKWRWRDLLRPRRFLQAYRWHLLMVDICKAVEQRQQHPQREGFLKRVLYLKEDGSFTDRVRIRDDRLLDINDEDFKWNRSIGKD